MSFVYLDTHIAADLYHGLVEDLTNDAKRNIEAHELLISPAVLLELGYMHQLKRMSAEARTVMSGLNATFGVNLCQLPFSAVAYDALNIGWTNDPFDRLIVAQATANANSRLITKDRLIRKHYSQSVW